MTDQGIRQRFSRRPAAVVAPLASRAAATVAGHWLLARLGKRVLWPGGAGLTRALLTGAAVGGADVVELAPGLGRTAADIIAHRPRSYLGVEGDREAAHMLARIVDGVGRVRHGDAADTCLPDGCADVVIGEAMLSMQTDTTKEAIVAEAVRLLRPGGRYGIHDLALTPDTVGEETKATIRLGLARAIRVNARPLTVAEWRQLLTGHDLVVDRVATAPMALLEPSRLIADEGLIGALRFAVNLLIHPDARRRVWAMRRTFRGHLGAVAVIARKPHPMPTPYTDSSPRSQLR